MNLHRLAGPSQATTIQWRLGAVARTTYDAERAGGEQAAVVAKLTLSPPSAELAIGETELS